MGLRGRNRASPRMPKGLTAGPTWACDCDNWDGRVDMRPLTRISGSVIVGLVAVVVACGAAVGVPPARPTQAKPYATMSVTFTQRHEYDAPSGIEKWEETTVSIKKARAFLSVKGMSRRYKGTAHVTLDYKNHYLDPDGDPSTMDCGLRTIDGTIHWTGDIEFEVDHTFQWIDKGDGVDVDTWIAITDAIHSPPPTYVGTYHEWENTQLKNCVEKPWTSTPMGWFGPLTRRGFGVSGRLGIDRTQMLLTHLESSPGDTYLINGWMKFSAPLP
jgi:hypothetical protein